MTVPPLLASRFDQPITIERNVSQPSATTRITCGTMNEPSTNMHDEVHDARAVVVHEQALEPAELHRLVHRPARQRPTSAPKSGIEK